MNETDAVARMAAAAQAGDLLALRSLLEDDATLVHSRSADGWTPLHLAVFFGRVEAARLLVAAGADVCAVSENAMANQPLHAAAAGRHLDAVELLVSHGADVDALQHGGWTALQAAAQHGDIALAEYLLAHGADPALVAGDGRNAGDLATAAGHHEVAEVIRRAAAR